VSDTPHFLDRIEDFKEARYAWTHPDHVWRVDVRGETFIAKLKDSFIIYLKADKDGSFCSRLSYNIAHVKWRGMLGVMHVATDEFEDRQKVNLRLVDVEVGYGPIPDALEASFVQEMWEDLCRGGRSPQGSITLDAGVFFAFISFIIDEDHWGDMGEPILIARPST